MPINTGVSQSIGTTVATLKDLDNDNNQVVKRCVCVPKNDNHRHNGNASF